MNLTQRNRIHLALTAVILIQMSVALLWMWLDQTPPYWDEAWYLWQGAAQLDALGRGVSAWYEAWLSLDPTRPSLVSTLTMPLFAVFGRSADAGLLLNVLALPVLILATYALAADIAGARTGLLAALLVGSYPMMQALAHILLVEFVMVTWVAVMLLALYRSEGFSHTGWSFAAGAVLGLGALTKVFFPAFVALPLLVTLWPAFRRPRRLGNAVLCGTLALGVASLWYIPNLNTVVDRSLNAAVGREGAPYGPANPLHWQNLLGYFFSLIGTRISVAGFGLLLLGGIGLFRHRSAIQGERRALLLLLGGIIGPYLLFTTLNNQDLKHISGIMPAVAILTAWGLARLTKWAELPVILFAAVYTLAGSFPGPLANFQPQLSLGGASLKLFHAAQPAGETILVPPNPEAAAWPLDPLLDYGQRISMIAQTGKPRAHVATIPDHVNLESYMLRWRAAERSLPLKVQPAYPATLWDQDVLIHKTASLGFEPHRPVVEGVEAALSEPDSPFHKMPLTIPLPDGSEAYFYARLASPLLESEPHPAVPVNVQFEEIGRLLGVDLHRPDAHSLEITYYWKTLGPSARPQTLFVHFTDPATGEIHFQDDHPLFPITYPTSFWQNGRWLAEKRTVTIPPAYRERPLSLLVGMYDETGRRAITAPENLAGQHSVTVTTIEP